MTKFVNIKTKYGYDYIFNMDNVCHINYFNGKMTFTFNFPVSYLERPLGPETEIMECSKDEYKAIVNFLKSKDETYLELELE